MTTVTSNLINKQLTSKSENDGNLQMFRVQYAIQIDRTATRKMEIKAPREDQSFSKMYEM